MSGLSPRLTPEEREAAAAELTLAQDYRAVFATAEGRRVLADILRRNFACRSPVVIAGPDAGQAGVPQVDASLTLVNAGRQHAALGIALMAGKTDAEIIAAAHGRAAAITEGEDHAS